MISQKDFSCRQAKSKDKQPLANLIHFETLVHRHLDWRSPLEWLGNAPYLIVEHEKNLVAALACPPDPPETAWIRLFAVSSIIEPVDAWQILWTQARQQLTQLEVEEIAAISLQDWFSHLLRGAGFMLNTHVVMLVWETGNQSLRKPRASIIVRPLDQEDIKPLEELDRFAFDPIWRISRVSINAALRQAAVATIAEVDGQIAGYQISTANHMGGHVARLAVHPKFHRRGIASELLEDTLVRFTKRGALRVTVNTQEDNLASLALYRKFGFRRTGESYSVYCLSTR